MRFGIHFLLIALLSLLATLAAAQNSSDLAYSDRVHLQQFLIDNGHLQGDADGAIGPRTRAAMHAYFGVVDPPQKLIREAIGEDDAAFEVLDGIDLPEGDYRKGTEDDALRNITLRDCQQLCSGDTACMAYTYNVKAKVCFLKSVANLADPFEAAVSGRRLSGALAADSLANEATQPQVPNPAENTVDQLCEEPAARLIPTREGIGGVHSEVLAFLNTQDIPLGGFTGDYKHQYDEVRARALIPAYRDYVERARLTETKANLGILLFDLVRLYYAGDRDEDTNALVAARAETERLLDGLSDDAQAADIGAALQVSRAFSLEADDLPRFRAILENHQRHFGVVRRQWAIYSAMARVAYGFRPPPDERQLREAALRDRINWAQSLGDKRLVTDATGAWLIAKIDDITLGIPPTPGQLRPLAESAREILDEVELRAEADLELLVPVYEAGVTEEPCRSISVDTVNAVMTILLSDGTSEERRRVLEFGVLHTLNRNMFATEVSGVLEMSRSLLAMRLVAPELYRQAAGYLTLSLQCTEGQPRAACVNQAFSEVFYSVNAGSLALDFGRDAYIQTKTEAPESEAAQLMAMALANLEWRFGSVSAAIDLFDEGSRGNELGSLDMHRGHKQDTADLLFDLAVATFDDRAADSLIVETIKNRMDADAKVPDGTIMAVDAPSPSRMVDQLVSREVCGACSQTTFEIAYEWLDRELAVGSPWALLLQRYRTLSDDHRRQQAISFLERLFGPRPSTIYYEQGALSGLSPAEFANMRSPAMDVTQLANVLALSQVHPQLTSLTHIWAREFVRFMVEPDLQRKRAIYDHLLTVEYSVSLEFGDDIGYMAGLAKFSKMSRAVGYNLAAQVVDEHLVRMFDERLVYLSEETRTASLHEEADILVPALARLARAAFNSGDLQQSQNLLERLNETALAALEVNWSTGDERVVIKFRRLESALRLSAQLLTRIAEATSAQPDEAFHALQLAMLGDTAVTAQASQRRRLLVDPAAKSALENFVTSQVQLDTLHSYRDLIGISDPEWEGTELRSRQQHLDLAEQQLVAYFADRAGLSLKPMTMQEAQGLLEVDEGLLVLHSGTDATYGIFVNAAGAPLSWISEISQKDLFARVASVRAGVELAADGTPSLDFPFAAAHGLLVELLGPVWEDLDRYDHILIVADGPLQSLPLGILPTRVPDVLPRSLQDYRDLEIGWFGIEKTLQYLPTVGSLRARQVDGTPSGQKPFMGIGNPSFVGGDNALKFEGIYDAEGIADQSVLRRLKPLFASEIEVTRLAEISGADASSDTLLGDAATETAVKQLALEEYRVLLFATHGLTAGAVGGVNEPGLALSLPKNPNFLDDGYLGLSEVNSLKLNAELVILSACNTGASDGRSSSAGLSGLARGFLGAGAESVAVTHWSIPSVATVALNVEWFRAKNEETDDWADALRLAMRSMVDSLGEPKNAHPSHWGAFVVFGAPAPI